MPKIYEYRGVEGLVAAEVIEDTAANFTTGEVFDIAGVSEIAKSTDSTNESHYYDNVAAVVTSSTGADEVTMNTSAIPLDVLAKITGQAYEADMGMFIEQERTPNYFALGYKTKDTNGNVYFVWRLKGRFGIPAQTNETENDGTDANGQELVYTGVSTIHQFTKTGKKAKAITVDTSVNPQDAETFFAAVQTPDTVVKKNG
jgi:phi13 family phage major tail protein